MLSNLARKWSAWVLEPIARLLARLHVTPNQATVLGFLLTAAVAVIIALGYLRLAGFLLIGTLALDAVDGTLARMTGAVSRFGGFLDSTLDRWAEIALYFGLAWYFTATGQSYAVLLTMAVMAASLMVSYTRARAEGIGIPLKEGVFTRFERLTVLIIGLVFSNYIVWALAIIAVLAGITAVQRILATKRLATSLS
jgi:CDP-diacylglycerol--glycerol-3-phosphate 3-phosphatidyltransferase